MTNVLGLRPRLKQQLPWPTEETGKANLCVRGKSNGYFSVCFYKHVSLSPFSRVWKGSRRGDSGSVPRSGGISQSTLRLPGAEQPQGGRDGAAHHGCVRSSRHVPEL